MIIKCASLLLKDILMKIYLLLLSLLATTGANAECWIVDNMKGYSAFSQDEYKFEENSIDDGKISIEIDNNNITVTQLGNSSFGEGMMYTPINNNSFSGHGTSLGMTIIENWVITSGNKALFNRSVLDTNKPDMTSTTAMVGDIIGKC